MSLPDFYTDFATWWPLMSAPDEYAEEAAAYHGILRTAVDGPLDRVLELGCGGGNNALHMKANYRELVLTDLSEGMLAVSRSLNPDCEHVRGDMRRLRLGRTFDAVFVHDAVCYMTTEMDLLAAMQTAFVHCRSGGAALFCPDHVRENFRASTDCGGHDGVDRALRYLEWVWDPDPGDTTYIADYVFVMRDGDGVSVHHDRHVDGLFARADWLRLLATAGFEEARSVLIEHSELEPGSYEVFVARR